ncbi:MAG: ABC transporter ATP-binding protein [Oscillospiraceae bacterium]|nr:ABC transporter ATP-binding protein [Oscillospiraceae bacterium]
MIEISNVSMIFENRSQPNFNAKKLIPFSAQGAEKPSGAAVPSAAAGYAAPFVSGSPEKIFNDAPEETVNNRVIESKHREKALDNVSLVIPDSCIYGFLGSNGAGKSTLMRMICGVYRTDEGSIKIDGQEVFDNSEAKSSVFFVNDETIEYTGFTLESLMMYYRNYYPATFDTGKFKHLASVLGLPLNSPLSTFSKGMKRQSVVIIGLASCAKYLMLDEAFDGLDPAMRAMVKNIILDEIRGRNATLIVSSHNVHEIGELCDRAMLIHNGKIIFADELENIRGRFVKYQLASLNHTITQEEISAAGLETVQYKAVGNVVQIIVKGSNDTYEKVSAVGADLAEQIPLTLEEIFIYEMDTNGYRL